MSPKYRTLEEKKNLKRAVYLTVLSVGLLTVFFFWGLPLLARFSTFIADLRKSSEPVDINDTTPPAPPFIEVLPQYTKDPSIEIKGQTEEGVTVRIYSNGKEDELVADKDGEFVFTFDLLKGENSFSAKAIDKAGNESQETKVYKIVNDNEAPEITINSPQNGESFYGSENRQLTIEGQTEEGATLTINDRLVVVDQEGKFSYTISLSEGDNNFNIKSKDKAQNETEINVKVSFTP